MAAYEDLGAGARAPGMGNVFVGLADDVYSIYYNPAGLATLERPEAGIGYSRLYIGLTDNSNLYDSFVGYAQPLADGQQGTLGVAWNQFALDSLYMEQSYYLSYGRALWSGVGLGDIYGGVSLKYLDTSLNVSEGANNSFVAGGAPAASSKGVFDADAGLLYKFAHYYSVGFDAMHLPQPNVSFNSGDNYYLAPEYKLGLNYGSLISNLGLEYDNEVSPYGTRDSIVTAGAERWFPHLYVGDFAARGSVGIGSRDYTQITLGLAYRTRRFQVDYAFVMPLSGIQGTAGTHRFDLTFKFGKPTEQEESLLMVLEAMRRLREGAALAKPEVTGTGLTADQRAQVDMYLAEAISLELEARYKEAENKLSSALQVAPAEPSLIAAFGRLNLAAEQFPVLVDFRSDPIESTLHQGILAFLGNKDAEAVAKTAQALSLKPANKDVDVFLSELERVTGIRRPPVAKANYELASLLTRANAAIQDGRYREAADLSRKALGFDAHNALAFENLGTANFAIGSYVASLDAWKTAYQYETAESVRRLIEGYLASLRRIMKGPAKKTPKARPAASKPKMTPEEIQSLYDHGVDYYTHQEFQKAREAFEELLQADPNNTEAKKALRRVKDELKQ